MFGGEPTAAVLGRPVDPGEARVVDAPLPRAAFVTLVGRQDGPVVARRVCPVLGEPSRRVGSERFDVDHGVEHNVRPRRRTPVRNSVLCVGFLDKAKKLAEQAKDLAEGALAEAKARQESSSAGAPVQAGVPAGGGASQYGTPYVPGMLGRPGWRERGLADPAAVLPVGDRDRVGVPHSTKSMIVEEPFGMGRRWSNEGRSAGLFYRLYPEHQTWQPPGGAAPSSDVAGASTATLDDGRALVFVGSGDRSVVLEVSGLDDAARADLARAVAAHV